MERNDKVQVLLAQRPCLLRKALIARLEQEEWIQICATASSAEEVECMINRYLPRVLLINVSLNCNVGLLSLRRLKADHFWLGIVAFSCDSDLENTCIGQAQSTGADGYVSTGDSLEDLVRAIRSAREGKPYMSEWTKQNRREHGIENGLLLQLSRREAEVFCLTGCGLVPQRIAEMMNLSVKTVESYRDRIRKKMNLPKGPDLQYAATSFMRNAARRGIVGSDEELVKEMLSATG